MDLMHLMYLMGLAYGKKMFTGNSIYFFMVKTVLSASDFPFNQPFWWNPNGSQFAIENNYPLP